MTAIVGTDGIDIYRTTDSGLSWDQMSRSPWPIGITYQYGALLIGIANGFVLQSADNGVTWSVRNPTDLYNWSGLAVAGNTLLATNGTEIWRTTDGGLTWGVVDTGHSVGGIVHLSGLIWIAGTGDGVIRSTDDGVSWTQALSTPDTSIGVAGGGSAAVAINAQTNAGWRSADGGATWAPITPPANLYFWDGRIAYGGGVFIAPAFVISNGSYAIYRSTDGGLSWTALSPTTFQIVSIWYIGTAFYVTETVRGGGGLPAEQVIRRSTDGGLTWPVFYNPGTGIHSERFGYLTTMYGAGGNLWAVSDYTFRSTDSGTTFNPVFNGGAVSVADDNGHWMVPGDFGISHSADDGVSWSLQLIPEMYNYTPPKATFQKIHIFSMVSRAGTTLLLFGNYLGADKLYRSVEHQIWVSIPLPPGFTPSILDHGNGRWILTNTSETSYSDDDGVTWSPPAPIVVAGAQPYDYTPDFVASGGETWLSVAYNSALPGDNRVPLVSTDTGMTWTLGTHVFNDTTYATAGDDQFIAVDYDSIHRSPDGVTWTSQHFDDPIDPPGLASICHASGIWLISGGSNLYRSTDGGGVWAVISWESPAMNRAGLTNLPSYVGTAGAVAPPPPDGGGDGGDGEPPPDGPPIEEPPPIGDDSPFLSCDPVSERGMIRIYGNNIPDGRYTIERKISPNSPWEDVRGGAAISTTGGFLREDPEPPFGTPVHYRVTVAVGATDRYIQRNLVYTPSFGAAGAAPPDTVHPGEGRTITQVVDPVRNSVIGRVSGNPTGAPNPTPASRTIAEFDLKLTPGVTYQVTGKIKYHTTTVNRWVDVLAEYPNWQSPVSQGTTWADIYGDSGHEFFTRIFLSLSNGPIDYVAPIEVTNPTPNDVDTWKSFSAHLKVPPMPAVTTAWNDVSASQTWDGTDPAVSWQNLDAQYMTLRILHGTNVREYSATWSLDEIGAMPMSEVGPNYLYWFDGDTPVPGNPVSNKWIGTNFVPLSPGTITWDGTPHSSTSTFRTPALITAEVVCQIESPDPDELGPMGMCNPIFLNDPVQPRLGQWFGLISIESLTYSARRELYSVIRRASQIAVNDLRQMAAAKMSILTFTRAQRKMALALFSSGRVIAFRNPDLEIPEGNEDGPWYLSMGDVEEIRPFSDHGRPERLWNFDFARVDKPKGGVIIIANTWQNVKGEGSWGNVKEGREDWLDVLLNPDTTTAVPARTVLPTLESASAWRKQQLPGAR